MTVLICLVSFIVLSAVFLYFFPLAIVIGDSMFPSIKEGEVYLSRRVLFPKECSYHVSKVYVYKPPNGHPKYVIKRLQGIHERGLQFLGDNSDASFDSRHYGLVDKELVIAVVLFKTPIKLRKA